jgi:Zn-dependent protease
LFNLIPVPPLDGSKVLMYFLPLKAQIKLMELERYSMIIFIIIIATPVVSYILMPPALFIANLIFNTIGVNIL